MSKIKNILIEMQETPIMEACSDCWGEGTIEVEHPRYRGPSRGDFWLGFSQIF